ncbi:hypothetical protein FJQ98_25420 [Lysinibacillus agricola]|uniref:Uncharacterized protein n=1 Tax=Lysinibacillus agricola TaxID=2590012 RepID=A0ABX7AQZ6_9BACI|nr:MULTISPECIES: hypothetical protein [Lysinibacillus]QQP12372.1 hypothetical protein FJQ98_25420 [Lysinibacillus agricola]
MGISVTDETMERLIRRPQEALRESEASAAMFYLCESEASATNVFCSESKASATKRPVGMEIPPRYKPRYNTKVT